MVETENDNRIAPILAVQLVMAGSLQNAVRFLQRGFQRKCNLQHVIALRMLSTNENLIAVRGI